MQREQQKTDEMFAVVTANSTLSSNSSSTTTQRSGVTTNFLYKLIEIAAYTSVYANDAYQIMTTGGDKIKQEIKENDGTSKKIHSRYHSIDMLRINVDDSDDPDANSDELSDKIAQNSNGVDSNWLLDM
ncbi:7607_t:CDS:1 [Cetraspora pellucida]|uniref:7607_t:CDS:1 n=1 Tax=Cetraspora pellucida TaxID=1433469 RepID=A0A9N9IK22_9GLOM|nr:7607_t:CDS:1 [Cetraspora pellucida]